jgi:hypothetical protein
MFSGPMGGSSNLPVAFLGHPIYQPARHPSDYLDPDHDCAADFQHLDQRRIQAHTG